MTVVIFSGPTLAASDVQQLLECEVRAPAARGDVLAAALEHPCAIGLIDGRFDGVPSVWHKELLWAMSRGIHVWGSASMGALRAAELAAFGMIGTGEIFEAYRSEVLQNDDEVVVAHAGAERGYRALSDALVNLRWSFRAAARAGVVSSTLATELERIGQSLPYPERTFSAVLRTAEAVLGVQLAELRNWLPAQRVDRKREDALLMLKAMRDRQRSGWGELRVSYDFAYTDAWHALERQMRQLEAAGSSEPEQRQLTHELLIAGGHLPAYHASLARALAEAAVPGGAGTNERALGSVADEFRRERGLEGAPEFEAWIAAQFASEPELTAFFQREAQFRRALDTAPSRAGHLADYLRATGHYARFAARGKTKESWLAAHGLGSAGLAETGLSAGELWQWYVTERLNGSAQATLQAHARSECVEVDELRDAIVREYLYSRAILK